MKSIAILWAVVSSIVAIQAEIVFSAFGPSDSYNTEFAAGLGYMFENEKFIRHASQFTINASTSYFFDGIDAAVGGWGAEGTVRFDLMSDSDGLPGTVLESFNLIARGVSMEGEILSASSDLHPILVAGQNYWLAARAEAEPFASLFWNLGSGVQSPTVTQLQPRAMDTEP